MKIRMSILAIVHLLDIIMQIKVCVFPALVTPCIGEMQSM